MARAYKFNPQTGSMELVITPDDKVVEKNTEKMPEVKDEVQKEMAEAQARVLKATVEVRPTQSTTRIRPTNIVTIYGVGKTLSGRYYVDEVVWVIDDKGLSITFEMTKAVVNDAPAQAPAPRDNTAQIYDEPIGPEPAPDHPTVYYNPWQGLDYFGPPGGVGDPNVGGRN